MRILAIETSCDETAVCVVDADGVFGPDFRFRVLGNALLSQASLHTQYGGVFPNLAKREHAKNLTPLLELALKHADLFQVAEFDISNYRDALEKILVREPEMRDALFDLLVHHAKPAIDAIAVTSGPGLEPALWMGVNFARALSVMWDIPLVAVNHMEGHMVVSMMETDRLAEFEFPVLSLLISGGHTELVVSKNHLEYEIIGATRDDAVGEAFDKVARLLGLPYPGGPEISRLAAEAREKHIPSDIKLPRPMMHEDNFDFSFAGLKTAVRRIVEAHTPLSEDMRLGIAREFEDAAADVLVGKTLRAVDAYGVNTVVVGGGVSANEYIRLRLASALAETGHTAKLLTSPPELSTDNAIMIALAGYFRAQRQEFADPATLRPDGNLRLAV